MKKQLLVLLPAILMLGSIVSVSASDDGSVGSTMTNTTTTQPVSLERQALQEKARLTREEDKSLRQTSSGARADFRTTNSGALKEMKKGLTDANKADIKKIHDERVAYIQSLSGMTLEQKAQYMSGMEDKIRHEIETRYSNATGSLQTKRMEVYEQNAARRAEMLANQLELRSDRGALRTTEIDAMIAKITAELPNLSTEKKTKLAKKIDEKIVKIQANKKLPDANKTEIVAKLNALKSESMK
jgi:hypothetical protein